MTDLEQFPAVLRAREAWGGDIPDWVLGLARACAQSSQNKVAKKLGYSASLVSNVIGNRYTGDMQRVEDMYRGAFERAEVACPELGDLPLNECHMWQKHAERFQGTNGRKVRMYRACRRCKRFKKSEPKPEGQSDD